MKFVLIFTFAAFLLQKGLELSTLVGLRLSSEGGLLRHSECTVHNWAVSWRVDLTVADFSLPCVQWCTLNQFENRLELLCILWGLPSSQLCICSDTDTTFHIVESCLINKLDDGIHRLQSADETAI